MNLCYKKATPADINLLTDTRITVLRAANGLDESVDMETVRQQSYDYYDHALQDESHIAYLVMDDEQIAATGGVSFYRVMPTYHNPNGSKAYIMNMYTAPDYRRKGIAYRVLDLLVSASKERGISHITLEATDMGKPLYKKYGFTEMDSEMILY